MSILRSIMIDDDREAINSFSKMIESFFSKDIEITGTFISGIDALSVIESLNPDIIFVDMEMSGINGLETIHLLPEISKAKVVVVSGSKDYAIKAIKYNVFDYLLKPLTISDFKTFLDKIKLHTIETNVFEHEFIPDKVIVQSHDKTFLLEYQHIKRIEASGSYSIIYYQDQEIYVSKNLKSFDGILPPNLFYRPHRSHIVNFNFIDDINKVNLDYHLALIDGTLIEISKKKKIELTSLFNKKI
jgi:two-component system, LytTR family, response regulator